MIDFFEKLIIDYSYSSFSLNIICLLWFYTATAMYGFVLLLLCMVSILLLLFFITCRGAAYLLLLWVHHFHSWPETGKLCLGGKMSIAFKITWKKLAPVAIKHQILSLVLYIADFFFFYPSLLQIDYLFTCWKTTLSKEQYHC